MQENGSTSTSSGVGGRRWWCACGQLTPWVSDTLGPHNSQHLFDPYSFIHVLHGLLFFWLFAWAFPRLAPTWRLCLAVALSGSIQDAWLIHAAHQMLQNRGKFLHAGECSACTGPARSALR